MIVTSAMSGTLVRWNVPSVSSVVAISFSTEFLAPGTVTDAGERTVAPDEDRIVAAGGGRRRSVRGGLLGRIHGPPVCSAAWSQAGASSAAAGPTTPNTGSARSTPPARRRRARTRSTAPRACSRRREGPFAAYRRTVEPRRRRAARDDRVRRDDPLVRLAVPLAGPRGAGAADTRTGRGGRHPTGWTRPSCWCSACSPPRR